MGAFIRDRPVDDLAVAFIFIGFWARSDDPKALIIEALFSSCPSMWEPIRASLKVIGPMSLESGLRKRRIPLFHIHHHHHSVNIWDKPHNTHYFSDAGLSINLEEMPDSSTGRRPTRARNVKVRLVGG